MKHLTAIFLGLFGLGLFAPTANGAIVKSANGGKTSVHPTITTTTGQKQILLAIDPISITSFNLQVQFDADKVSFTNIQGVNGYTVDYFEITYSGNIGFVTNITGHYISSTHVDPIQTTPPVVTIPAVVPQVQPVAPLPPPGEVVLFNILFNDNAPDRSKGFVVSAGPNGYLNGVDEVGTLYALAPNQIDPIDVQIAADAVPLPPVLGAGAMGGLMLLIRRRFV